MSVHPLSRGGAGSYASAARAISGDLAEAHARLSEAHGRHASAMNELHGHGSRPLPRPTVPPPSIYAMGVPAGRRPLAGLELAPFPPSAVPPPPHPSRPLSAVAGPAAVGAPA